MRRLASLAVALAALAPAAGAQGRALPLVNNGVPGGVSVAADVAFPSDEYGGGTALGANIHAGIGLVGLSAQVGRHSRDGEGLDDITSLGGTATLRLFGGPLVPFRVLLQGGYARWDWQEDDITGLSQSRLTGSLGFAATIPVPAFALKPWVAPRIERLDAGGDAHVDFGISGGFELGFLNGLSLRASYDKTWVTRGNFSAQPTTWSVGIGKGL